MKTKYLIRLDDACSTMDKEKWECIEDILDEYGIMPLVGIVPHNEDDNLIRSFEDEDFWEKVNGWVRKGWSIALHGYNHCYTSKTAGINPFWHRSEFAGLPLDAQKEKIRTGVAILRKNGINPQFFFAPSHTFDRNTIEALRTESDIRIISDTIGRYPYQDDGFFFIPQIVGHCTEMPFSGIYTFCFHPNTMKEANFQSLESFIRKHHSEFISFDQIDLPKYSKKKTMDRLISWSFFTYRRLRGLK